MLEKATEKNGAYLRIIFLMPLPDSHDLTRCFLAPCARASGLHFLPTCMVHSGLIGPLNEHDWLGDVSATPKAKEKDCPVSYSVWPAVVLTQS